MPYATGPWCRPPELPTDPKRLCLVLIEHPRFGRGYHVMRYLRNNWQFQEGLALSGNQRVIAWAEIDTDIPEPVRPMKEGTVASSAVGDRIEPQALERLMKKFNQ